MYLRFSPRWRLIKELQLYEIKNTPEEIVDIVKLKNGKIVFLEEGTSQAGLKHIVERHLAEFAAQGISERQIPRFLMLALQEGEIVGFQGAGQGRPIYEVHIGGKVYYVAITVSSNGYIVGANMTSKP